MDTKEIAQGYENIKTAFDAIFEKNKDFKGKKNYRIMNPLNRLYFYFESILFGPFCLNQPLFSYHLRRSYLAINLFNVSIVMYTQAIFAAEYF